jgi:ubiquinone/menaquinone biosynthesis C-methylase UbiE
LDAFVAASQVGSTGKVVGIDMTPEMLELPRKAQEMLRADNLRFLEASVEELPFDDASFDLVISNGVLNLVPDKDAAFREIARVLRSCRRSQQTESLRRSAWPGRTYLVAPQQYRQTTRLRSSKLLRGSSP